MIKQTYMYLVVVVSAILSAGCASTTHFTSLPKTDAEFSQSIESIKTQHHDVSRYEAKEIALKDILSFKSPPQRPTIRELNEIWGEPDNKKKHWGEWFGGAAFNIVLGAATGLWTAMAISELMFIVPHETYVWKKGPTNIEARVTTLGFHGYEKRLAIWKWSNSSRDLAAIEAEK